MHVDVPFTQLSNQLIELKKEIYMKEHQLASFVKYRNIINIALVDKLNEYNLNTSQNYAQYVMDDTVFAIEGWVSSNHIKKLVHLLDKEDIHGEEIAIEATDKKPTHLENKGTARIGEDLVNIYDAPGANDVDPSSWVLWAFALFFAVIIGDGGYGLIFLIISLFCKIRYPSLKGIKKRLVNLMVILSSFCIIWGFLTASFFSIRLDIDNPIQKASLIQWIAEKKAEYEMYTNSEYYQQLVKSFPAISKSKDGFDLLKNVMIIKKGKKQYLALSKFSDSIMLELAIIFGIFHLTFSFIRNLRKHWAGIGWIIFMYGAYFYFPKILDTTNMGHYVFGINNIQAASSGLEMVFVGIGSAIVLALLQKKLAGAAEVQTVLQVFADVLSYLRLYALALSGTMMASTFNDIGSNMGFVIGIVIIIIGHLINIALSVMGGVIHGLRLNFLEWYHYCFEGGGKLLKPLMLLNTDFHNKYFHK